MGRPRKDANALEAKERLVETFWELLKTNKLHEITVGSLVSAANCNRGTFYYHYSNLEDLIQHALERDIRGAHGSVAIITELFLEREVQLVDPANLEGIKHASLMMRQGGYHITSTILKDIISQVWFEMICEDDEQITYETELFLEFLISGVLGVMNRVSGDMEAGFPIQELPRTAYLNNLQVTVINEISRTQGISTEEMLKRIQRNRHKAITM